ncbi:MAG: PAS domain S-box protein, partial [Nitrospirae bacterium]
DIIGVIVFAVDITERVQAEAALQNAQAGLELQVEERTRSLGQANEALRAQIQERLLVEEALKTAHAELEQKVTDRTADLVRANLELTVEIHERERVVEALRASEARLAKTEAVSLVMVTHVGLDGRWLKIPPTLCELLGYTEEELLAGTFKDVTHPDDFEADWSQCKRLISGEIKSFDLEKRYIRKDGKIIWIYLNCSAVNDEDGKLIHFITYIRDITRRKQAEEELQQSRGQLRALATHLESVREEERARIAREVHDELGQAMTALNMDLAWLRKRLPKTGALAPLREKTAGMAGLISDTIESVRRIVSELRPSALDQLGLEAAIEWQASEFEKRFGIACRLSWQAQDVALNEQLSTSLFRILQEALTNVARHADATSVIIRLEREAGGLRLDITDDGAGISEEVQANPRSFGIMGMRERALAFGGTLVVEGLAGKGTTVRVRVPL